MFCPACKETSLVMSERKGIEIDYCPQCRGVWLDRGELDKIIERSALEQAAPTPAQMPTPAPAAVAPSQASNPGWGQSPQQYDRQQHERQHYDKSHHNKPYRKKSFLEDLFD